MPTFSILQQHTCEIEHQVSHEDRYGQPRKQAGTTETVACRLSSLEPSKEERTQLQRDVVQRHVRLFLPPEANVTEHDVIARVLDASGNQIAGRLDIDFVRKLQGGNGVVHHIELDCHEIVR